MSKQALYPYPRLRSVDVQWGPWEFQLNGSPVDQHDIPDLWDANSDLHILRSVQIDSTALERLGSGEPEFYISLACAETATFQSARTNFVHEGKYLTASVSLKLHGDRVASTLSLGAQIAMPARADLLEEFSWLTRCIIAEAKMLTVPLSSNLAAFPTAAFSFKDASKFPAPWEISITATDLVDNFATAVRLYLNTDLSPVVELVEGRPKPYVESSLDASIARAILLALLALSKDLPLDRSLYSIAAEFPDSVAAAGQRVAERFFNKRLDAVLKSYDSNPALAETQLLAASQFLQER